MKCERCKKETSTYIMSMFNEDMICLSCKKKEEDHPAYKEAREAEYNAVRSGNRYFAGIGKPYGL